MKLFVLRDTEEIHYEMLEIIIVKESIEEVNYYLNKFAEEYLTAKEKFECKVYDCYEEEKKEFKNICIKYNLFFGFSVDSHYVTDVFDEFINRFENLKVIVESETNLPEGVVCSLAVGG